MRLVVKRTDFPQGKRIICISDIHGSFELLKELLRKVGYAGGDILVLLGDLYTKGCQGHDTLKYIIELSQSPNVYVLRGNCDWTTEEYLAESEKTWLEGLPHVMETTQYIFVHGGLPHGNFETKDAIQYMKNDAYMEQGYKFDKYIITGHWPTINYTHEIPSYNPIVDDKSRIIAIDGGNAIVSGGQLNAFIIDNNRFSFEYVDDLPKRCVLKPQDASEDAMTITWHDRFVELIEQGAVFSRYRHLKTGKVFDLPNDRIWTDKAGSLCVRQWTDYLLPLDAGDEVSVIKDYSSKLLAKKDGIMGWVIL